MGARKAGPYSAGLGFSFSAAVRPGLKKTLDEEFFSVLPTFRSMGLEKDAPSYSRSNLFTFGKYSSDNLK